MVLLCWNIHQSIQLTFLSHHVCSTAISLKAQSVPDINTSVVHLLGSSTTIRTHNALAFAVWKLRRYRNTHNNMKRISSDKTGRSFDLSVDNITNFWSLRIITSWSLMITTAIGKTGAFHEAILLSDLLGFALQTPNITHAEIQNIKAVTDLLLCCK